EGAAAHDHVVAEGERLEPLQIAGQVPGEAVAAADDAVRRDGRDDGKTLHGGESIPERYFCRAPAKKLGSRRACATSQSRNDSLYWREPNIGLWVNSARSSVRCTVRTARKSN